jgi:MerC mercury resistance protein
MAAMSGNRQQLTWLPVAGTLLSIFACKGTLGIVMGLSLVGVTLHINVHVWAAAIVAFALVAVLGFALGYRQHGRSGTLLLGTIGALFVILSLYGTQAIQMMRMPSNAVELIGFAGLVVAGIWDWRLKKSCRLRAS